MKTIEIISFLVVLLIIGLTRTGIDQLSWSTLRKKENEDLHQRMQNWLLRRRDYLLTIDFIGIFLLLWQVPVTHWQNLPIPASALILTASYFGLTRLPGFLLPNRFSLNLLPVTMPILKIFIYLAMPLFYLLRLVGKHQQASEEAVTFEEEILSLMEKDAHTEQNDGSSNENDARKMIRGIFDLDDTYASEIMTPRVDIEAVEANAQLSEVIDKVISCGHSRIPVYEESIDNIIGVIFAKDLLTINPDVATDLKHLMHKPVYIPETKNIGALLDELRINKQHLAIIIDEYGGTSGLVTLEDIIEEIIGEIEDEYDVEDKNADHQFNPDGSIDLEGRLYIDEFNELLNGSIEEDEDYDTLAGFIIDHLGRIPENGEEFTLNNFIFNILEADARRVISIRVTPIESKDQEVQS